MPYHKLLNKQLERYMGGKEEIPESMKEFLMVVSRTYQTFERDKMLSEHAFAISEKEYQEVLQNIQVQHEIRDRSIAKLKETIISLDPKSAVPHENESDDLIGIVNYLEEQVRLTKELEKELINARDLAEKASRAKGDFLSVMSHEIRTPLNAIIGIAHVMLGEPLPASQLENMRTLQISAENLLNLINDILDFSKIEEGRIQLSEKSNDLRQLVTHIRMANRVRAEDGRNLIKVIMDPDLPETVMIDDVRISQILNNLVSNAVKFTSNGSITIEVQLVKDLGDRVVLYFAVSDTGIGIAKEKQELIFEHFSQANSEITREFGGSGLGLTIVRNLLHLMNSEIHVESEPGVGSKFFFTLDLQKGSAPAPSLLISPLNESNELKDVKVLLVEDVEFNVMVAEKMLTKWKATVDVAENGLVAIGKVKATNYDIILMDLQMPVLDGYSASRHIREFNQKVPIIALTASASSDVLEKTAAAGMNAYVSKPFKPNDLFEAILRQVENSRSL